MGSQADTTRERRVTERRLILVIGAVVFLDTMFYAVLAPLLPGLVHELHLSKLSAGVLTASYATGTLLGALPGGMLAARAGPRVAVCVGLWLLACSTIAFGFLGSAVTLDAARFVEGVGGACSWAGGLAWIVAETPADRRGTMIGRALAAAIGGSLMGPVIGTLATATGRPILFSALAVLAGILIVQTSTLPSQDRASGQGLGTLARGWRKPGIVAGTWLVALPAIGSGLINVLGPLRLHRLGAAAAAIGVTFLLAAAIETAVSPAVGTLSDRRGRLAPLRGGLLAACVTLACFTLPESAALLGALIVATTASLGAFWAPAMAMLSDAAEAVGLDQGLAAALMNLAWAGGQIVGSGGAGAIAEVTGDALPAGVAAGLCALTLVALGRRPASLGRLRSILTFGRSYCAPTQEPYIEAGEIRNLSGGRTNHLGRTS
jgi:MFS family permease